MLKLLAHAAGEHQRVGEDAYLSNAASPLILRTMSRVVTRAEIVRIVLQRPVGAL